MNYIKSITLILFVVFSASTTDAKRRVRRNKVYPISEGEMVKHQHYWLSYAEQYEGAYWVYYKLTPENIDGPGKRKDYFMVDTLVSTGSAIHYDYKSSGYDKGHLCPAAAMKMNQEAMDETFYMSNMSPQHPSLNRQKWRFLEEQVRDWVKEKEELHVVSGPIYTKIIEYIGENEVAVPGAYYKVIWDGKENVIAFILPNEKCEKSLQEYVVTVDSVQQVTNINFFSKIPNRIEKVIEKEINIENWDF